MSYILFILSTFSILGAVYLSAVYENSISFCLSLGLLLYNLAVLENKRRKK